MGNLRPLVMRGGLVESAPQSGEERGREHYGRKEERPRVRNEEKTYDYKGLLISLWRGVAWGSGVETGGTRGVPAFPLRDACRRWPCGNGLEDLSCCMMPCRVPRRYGARPAVSVGSALSLTLFLCYPAVWTRETRAAIFVPMVAFSLLTLTPALCLSASMMQIKFSLTEKLRLHRWVGVSDLSGEE